jgi:DNA-binding NarL/FixJ family response regulator
MGDAALRIWVEDQHPIFRRGIIACLEQAGFEIAGESSGFDPTPSRSDVDILLFDGDGPGLSKAAALARDCQGLFLLAILRESDEQHLFDAVDLGVAAVLMRQDLCPAALVDCVRLIAHGSATLPLGAVPRLLDRAAHTSRSGINGLTPRELDVLRLLADGEDTHGIAGSLCYSDRTVKNIVHDLLMKLNCRNRAHAVALATRQGLI